MSKPSDAMHNEANKPKPQNSMTMIKGRDFVSTLVASRIRALATIVSMVASKFDALISGVRFRIASRGNETVSSEPGKCRKAHR
jgi:hypothetical protein